MMAAPGATPPAIRAPRKDCAMCDGSGWLHGVQNHDSKRPYRSERCPCTTGCVGCSDWWHARCERARGVKG